MSIMDEAEIVSISRDDGIDRIYPPKGFRERIINSIHRVRHMLSALQVAPDEGRHQDPHL